MISIARSLGMLLPGAKNYYKDLVFDIYDILYTKQCFVSGSGLDPDSIESMDPDPVDRKPFMEA